MTTIAYQLYCSRNEPLDRTLRMLAEAGYTAVEGYGGLYDDVSGLKDGLEANGLAMPSGHFGLDMVEGEPARAMEIARTLGVKKMLVPFIMPDHRPTDRAGWEAFARRLVEAGKPVKDAGFDYGWHNHDFELVDLGGVTPLDLFAEAGLDLELDLGWVRVAGHDPAAWVDKLSDRIIAAHVKDIAADGEAPDEDGWADVGHGIMDWVPIKAALDRAGVEHFVLEHDKPSDPSRFAKRSLDTVTAWS